MSRYIARRLLFLLLTLLLTSMIIFVVTQWLPGDVARVILGREASEPALAALRAELGLDQPLPLQYVSWLGRFLTGDWGTSYSTGEPVRALVLERAGNSMMLAGLTLLIAVPLSLLLGVVAGLKAEATGFFTRDLRKIELAQVTEADSAGVALLIDWLRRARGMGLPIALSALPPAMSSLASLYGLSGIFSGRPATDSETIES